MRFPRILVLSFLVGLPVWMAGCTTTPLGATLTASAAQMQLPFSDQKVNGKTLPVVAQPPSLSYKRLRCYAVISSKIEDHLEEVGYPDLLREKTGVGIKREIEFLYPRQETRYRATLILLPTGVSQKFEGPFPIPSEDLKYQQSLKELKESVQ